MSAQRTRPGRTLWLILFWFLALSPTNASAHQSSVVYLQLVPNRHTLSVTLRIANSDLYEALSLPSDRAIRPDEAMTNRERLARYVMSKITVENVGRPCPGRLVASVLSERQGGFFIVDTFDFECPSSIEDVRLTYNLFFDLDPRHQGLARIELDGQSREYIFRDGNRTLPLQRPLGVLDYVLDYLRLGVEHIFTGYDHLAFLVGLLLLAGSLWRTRSRREALGYVLRVVTAFTVAHSLTLVLSALRIVSLPSRLVESAIALSIGYVAVENILLSMGKRRGRLAFGFGLVHGLGFASVLSELGLPKTGLMASLLSFNVGVELGQLTVVLLALPLLVALSRWRGYQCYVVRGGSFVLLLMSLIWFVERAFDMQLLSRVAH